MSTDNPSENTKTAGSADQSNQSVLEAKQRAMRFLLVGVYAALGVVLLILAGRYALPDQVFAGQEIGVVDVASLIEEYQRDALDGVVELDEGAQMEAVANATAFAERVDGALLVLAQRNPGLVLVQAQAVAVDAGVKDYTDELREILEGRAAHPAP